MGVACQILIDKPREGVHRAGQPVTGVVNYAIDKPTAYSDAILSLIGEGRCSWTESESTTSDEGPKSTTYTGTETYVTRRVNILGMLPGQTITLPFGSYKYPFEFILPRNIPPSFNDSTCTISYKVAVKFKKPGLFSWNTDFHVEIPVYGHVEHAIPYTPIVFGLDKVLFKPFSSKEQAVKLRAEVARPCLLPGENAFLSFDVTNDTDVELTSIITEVVCTTTYTADCGRQKTQRQNIKESLRGTVRVPKQSVARLSTVVPILPHLYSIQHAGVIRKSFELLVTVRLPMPHINPSVSVPIVIGEREGSEFCLEALELEAPVDQPPSYNEVMKEDKM